MNLFLSSVMFSVKKVSLFPAKTAVRCFKCVTTTNMLVVLSACLSVKLQWMIQVTKGKYRTTLEFKSSGCAVSNNLHYDSGPNLSVSVKVIPNSFDTCLNSKLPLKENS